MEQEPKGKVFPVHAPSIPPGALVIFWFTVAMKTQERRRHYWQASYMAPLFLLLSCPSTNRNVDFYCLRERVSAENWHKSGSTQSQSTSGDHYCFFLSYS
jgi:hypothetical protein